MNVYDSERMEDLMAPMGYQVSDVVDDADLVILNTCHIREKAADKVYSVLGRVREEKDKMADKGKRMVIAVAGCVAQAEGEEIIRRAPYVDIVVGSQAYQRLPQLVNNALEQKKSGVDLDLATVEKFDKLPENNTKSGPAAFLTVQEGCDKFCTFCVVPYTRGAEFSRSVHEVELEAKQLLLRGVREISLLGQNVNAYHGLGKDKQSWSLAKLVRRLAELDGLERIRYITSHPRDMDDDLIAAHGDVPQLMPFLHLPIQAGSDRVLKMMNRKHTAAEYLHIIDRLRKVRPDIALSSDFIVGFPGETDKDFEDTLQLVRDVNYAQCYSFKYSPRPGTPAALKEDAIPEDVKSERLARLQELLNEQQYNFNQSSVGQTLPVLLEREGKFEGQYVGRSPYMQAVHVMADNSDFGKIVEVKVDKAFANSLSGAIIKNESKSA